MCKSGLSCVILLNLSHIFAVYFEWMLFLGCGEKLQHIFIQNLTVLSQIIKVTDLILRSLHCAMISLFYMQFYTCTSTNLSVMLLKCRHETLFSICSHSSTTGSHRHAVCGLTGRVSHLDSIGEKWPHAAKIPKLAESCACEALVCHARLRLCSLHASETVKNVQGSFFFFSSKVGTFL